jgi:hypothetical protein
VLRDEFAGQPVVPPNAGRACPRMRLPLARRRCTFSVSFARHMKVAHRIPRDRRTAGRACGHISFILRWPGGSVSGRDWYRKSLTSIIRMFSGELERVSSADRPQATATLNAAVRKAGGGEKWIPLASWSGTQPVETFFQAARVAWRSLPKEDDNYRKVIVDDKRFDT